MTTPNDRIHTPRSVGRRREDHTHARLAAIVRDSADAIIGETLDGIITDWNPAAERLYGYTADEVVGKHRMLLVPPEEAEAVDAIVGRLQRGESIQGFEAVRWTKEGRRIDVALTISPVWSDAGEVVATSIIVRDITARKASEAELAATHQSTRQVLERITDGFCALDRDWRLTYINAAAEQIWGQSRHDLLGTNVWEAFAPAVETPLYAACQRAMREGLTVSVELYYPPLDGWYQVRAYPSADGLSVFFCDVSAGWRLTDELRASEAKFRTLVEQLPVVVYELAADDRQSPLYFSPFIRHLTGESPEEALAHPHHWLTLVHPDDQARIAAEDARTVASGEPFRAEYRHQRRDGSYVWVRDECVPVHDETGQVVAWQGVLLDMTDRVEAEAMQGHLAAIVEAAEDGILSVNTDGTIVSWNRGAERIYGYAAAEAIGQHVAMLRPPEHAEQIAREMARVWEGEVVKRHDTLRLTKDGRRIPVSLGIFPLRDSTGQIVGTSSITRDLTALRKTQEALHLRNRALDAASNGVLITNPLLPDNPIIDVNPAFTRLTGYLRDEVLGRNCRFLQGPDTDPATVQRLRVAIAAGSDTSETLLNYRQDGTPFWNDLSIAAVRDATGQLTHFIGVQTDATARKQLELELVASLEAAQAGIRAKTLFLAMMSHELRTPLQAVLGYADFLLNAPPGSLTPEQRDDVGFIRQGAGRMVTLIEQLLDLSRLEAGRLELAAGPVDLETILEQVRQDIAPVVTAKGLELTIDLPASLPSVLGDAVRLRQILLNLMGNAVKFTEAGSVRVSASVAADGVAVDVRDTGIGISEEALPVIFEEFRQVDGSLTRRHGGAGLGLAIARKLTEQMGGSIAVESTRGAGSTFTVWLPVALPSRAQHHRDTSCSE